jgi:hypothetical protein
MKRYNMLCGSEWSLVLTGGRKQRGVAIEVQIARTGVGAQPGKPGSGGVGARAVRAAQEIKPDSRRGLRARTGVTRLS